VRQKLGPSPTCRCHHPGRWPRHYREARPPAFSPHSSPEDSTSLVAAMLLAHCHTPRQAAAREDATHQLRGQPLAAAMSPCTTQGVETRTRMARTKMARAPRQSTVQRGPVSAMSTLPQPCSFACFAFASRVQQQLTTMLVCAQCAAMPQQTCNERAWPAASLATGALFSFSCGRAECSPRQNHPPSSPC